MKNNYFAAGLAGLFFLSSGLTHAEHPAGVPDYPIESKSYPVEAAEVSMGKVFGVQDQGGPIDYYGFELTEQNARNAGVRSILVPGWGQAFNGEKRKGALLFGTTAIAGALCAVAYIDSHHAYEDYKSSGRINDSHYDDYKQSRTLAVAMGSLAGVLWGYSIINAFSRGNHPVKSASTDFQIAMNPHGGDVRWQRKF